MDLLVCIVSRCFYDAFTFLWHRRITVVIFRGHQCCLFQYVAQMAPNLQKCSSLYERSCILPFFLYTLEALIVCHMCHVPGPGLCANAIKAGSHGLYTLWKHFLILFWIFIAIKYQALVRKNVDRIRAALGEYAYSRSQPVISYDVVVVINLQWASQMQFSQSLVEEKVMLLGSLFFSSVVLVDISIGRYTQYWDTFVLGKLLFC